jgi:hypothetical protein
MHFRVRISASPPYGYLDHVNQPSRLVAAIEWIHGVLFLTLFTVATKTRDLAGAFSLRAAPERKAHSAVMMHPPAAR